MYDGQRFVVQETLKFLAQVARPRRLKDGRCQQPGQTPPGEP
jgi:hypothetical protein